MLSRRKTGADAIKHPATPYDTGAKRQPRTRTLPAFFNRDCDDNGSGFDRSAYEMRR
jgi:hypothetical protein